MAKTLEQARQDLETASTASALAEAEYHEALKIDLATKLAGENIYAKDATHAIVLVGDVEAAKALIDKFATIAKSINLRFDLPGVSIAVDIDWSL